MGLRCVLSMMTSYGCDGASQERSDPTPPSQPEAIGKQPRSIENQPRRRTVESALPDGRVEAEFVMNTGGDQMSDRPRQAGLGIRVRFRDQEISQWFASCDDVGHGSAMAHDGAVEGAHCDGVVYDLFIRSNAVVVRLGQEAIVRIAVPR